MRIRWEVGGRILALTKEESNNQQGIGNATLQEICVLIAVEYINFCLSVMVDIPFSFR